MGTDEIQSAEHPAPPFTATDTTQETTPTFRQDYSNIPWLKNGLGGSGIFLLIAVSVVIILVAQSSRSAKAPSGMPNAYASHQPPPEIEAPTIPPFPAALLLNGEAAVIEPMPFSARAIVPWTDGALLFLNRQGKSTSRIWTYSGKPVSDMRLEVGHPISMAQGPDGTTVIAYNNAIYTADARVKTQRLPITTSNLLDLAVDGMRNLYFLERDESSKSVAFRVKRVALDNPADSTTLLTTLAPTSSIAVDTLGKVMLLASDESPVVRQWQIGDTRFPMRLRDFSATSDSIISISADVELFWVVTSMDRRSHGRELCAPEREGCRAVMAIDSHGETVATLRSSNSNDTPTALNDTSKVTRIGNRLYLGTFSEHAAGYVDLPSDWQHSVSNNPVRQCIYAGVAKSAPKADLYTDGTHGTTTSSPAPAPLLFSPAKDVSPDLPDAGYVQKTLMDEQTRLRWDDYGEAYRFDVDVPATRYSTAQFYLLTRHTLEPANHAGLRLTIYPTGADQAQAMLLRRAPSSAMPTSESDVPFALLVEGKSLMMRSLVTGPDEELLTEEDDAGSRKVLKLRGEERLVMPDPPHRPDFTSTHGLVGGKLLWVEGCPQRMVVMHYANHERNSANCGENLLFDITDTPRYVESSTDECPQ